MKTPSPGPGRRVGLREIAAAAGVCLMTASLSLRNHPKISPATRQRVRDCAERLGYRPDPEISRLMGRLRSSRRAPGSVVLAMIELRQGRTVSMNPYDVSIRRGITERADALGLGVTLFRIADYGGSLSRTLRVIRARGITGIILLPSSEPVEFDPALNWEGISVVAATTCVLTPRFHQVVPNQLRNMLTLLDRLHALQRRRVVAVLNADLEGRTHHHYSLALTWHGHRERILVLEKELDSGRRKDAIQEWLRRHQPDAIVTPFPGEALAALRLAGTRGRPLPALVVSLGAPADDRCPYQDELPELIGECAVGLVNGMMHNHDTGIPAHPQVTTIDGVLRAMPVSAA